MGIDLKAKKGNVEIYFGRSHYYKKDNTCKIDDMDFNNEMADISINQAILEEKLKGYIKYTPTSIKDAHNATEEFGYILEELLEDTERMAGLVVLKELKNEGFKFIEE